MFKLVGRGLVLLAFCWAGSASAAYMNTVYANGREWIQPIDFLGVANFASVCNITTGICTGTISGFDLNGWTWASYADVLDLLKSYEGGQDIQVGNNCANCWLLPGDILNQVLIDFTPTSDGRIDAWTRGSFKFIFNNFYHTTSIGGNLASFNPEFNYSECTSCMLLSTATGTSASRIGGWFSRPVVETQVPSPNTIPLIILALSALVLSRRKCVKS